VDRIGPHAARLLSRVAFPIGTGA